MSDPVFPKLDRKTLSLRVPAEASFDIKTMEAIQRIALGKAGCPECHSGFDLRWEFEEVIRLPELPGLTVKMMIR
jgi:hypothetical protein